MYYDIYETWEQFYAYVTLPHNFKWLDAPAKVRINQAQDAYLLKRLKPLRVINLINQYGGYFRADLVFRITNTELPAAMNQGGAAL